MDIIDALERSWEVGAQVVAGLTAEQLDAPTPCAGWDVRALLNHTLGEALMMTRVNQGQAAGNDHGDLVGDGGTLVATWAEVARENVASWRESGLEGDRTYFYGTFPSPASAIINLGEVVVHTWDLAMAIGRPAPVDPALAALVHQLYASVPLDGMRAGGMLGPEVEVSDGAPVADRMLALLGRRP